MTEEQQLFFTKLDSLNPGQRAALRRESGKLLHQADSKAIVTFYSCLPNVKSREEEYWFAIACLRCLWKNVDDSGLPLEQTISSLIRNGYLSDSVKHRVETLLDTKWDSDGYLLTKLARLVKLVGQKSNYVSIDFSALLEDLIYWNRESQSVQRKWAKAIFSDNQTDDKE